jgi:YetA-like protein
MTLPLQIQLLIEPKGPFQRRLEPVTCGIPWPRAVLVDVGRLQLADAQGKVVALQARVLDRWPDGSVRWTLLDWQANVNGPTSYVLRAGASGLEAPLTGPCVQAVGEGDGVVRINTERAQFVLRPGNDFPFESVIVGGGAAIDQGRTRFTVEDESGRLYRPQVYRLRLEEAGPVRAAVWMEGELVSAAAAPLSEFVCRMEFFAGSATVRFHLTLRNPRKAEHPGGLWDLGNGGSVYIRDASLTVALPLGGKECLIRCSPEPGAPFELVPAPLELYQDSSGGENWKSHNHLNRRRVVPNTFRGYSLRLGPEQRTGLRATPVVSLERDEAGIAVAVPYFWQNFPRAVEANGDALNIRLFPRQYADVHELQGGEQKTHTFSVAFAPDKVTNEPLAWCRAPLLPHATPEWYSEAEAVPYLLPRSEDPHTDYLRLVDAAIEGDDTFEHKREAIDEYGWRHFGDVYGDHEAVFHKGPDPLASHYNNQYDALAGFAFQFLRSADPRWWSAMSELARHVIDIDIYHTDRDKAGYNHGLFWHTYHYVDADTATHRTYPRAGKVCGGGPANEQNYTTGLMLYYFLTGDEAAREAALGLARWVIDMDDGKKSVFRWLAGGSTGLASSSRTPNYHGPGRGAANSVAALLDGHRLTGDLVFLAKAEQLIRRVIHPDDDVPARNLLDAENRWFYTMFLQSLARYLDWKAGLSKLDFMYAYARASLLHYARWMAEHEYPYLDRPEILEYPTETWAAQDMRKSEVFKHAALHTAGEERARFLERADFFFRTSVTKLSGMATRTLCRPVVLMLKYGYMHAWLAQHSRASAPAAAGEHDFGRPTVFVPQKARAKARLRILAAAMAVVGMLGLLAVLLRFIG